MKSREELNALKEDVEAMNKKLQELTEEELKMVTGGQDDQGRHASPYEYVGFDTSSCIEMSSVVDTCGECFWCSGGGICKYLFGGGGE